MNRDLLQQLEEVNRERARAHEQGPSIEAVAEMRVELRWSASLRLAVYGSLAPGRSNYHHLAGLPGRWQRGRVRGILREDGWGATGGFPALVWDPDAPGVEVHVLESQALPASWAVLDAFEGPAYLRILVPVVDPAGGLLTVANLYALAPALQPRGSGP